MKKSCRFVYISFFGVYLYFCNIFLSLPYENGNVYLAFTLFFLSRVLTFLHTDVPMHTRSYSLATFVPLRVLFLPLRTFFVFSQSTSRLQDT